MLSVHGRVLCPDRNRILILLKKGILSFLKKNLLFNYREQASVSQFMPRFYRIYTSVNRMLK